MRVLAIPVLTVVSAAALATVCISIVEARAPTAAKPTAIAWAGRVFTSKQEFAAWLDRRGGTYATWRERHPGAAPWEVSAVATRRAGGRNAPERASTPAAAPEGPSATIEGITAAAVMIAFLISAGGLRRLGSRRRHSPAVVRRGRSRARRCGHAGRRDGDRRPTRGAPTRQSCDREASELSSGRRRFSAPRFRRLRYSTSCATCARVPPNRWLHGANNSRRCCVATVATAGWASICSGSASRWLRVSSSERCCSLAARREPGRSASVCRTESFSSILDAIGDTPLVRLTRCAPAERGETSGAAHYDEWHRALPPVEDRSNFH